MIINFKKLFFLLFIILINLVVIAEEDKYKWPLKEPNIRISGVYGDYRFEDFHGALDIVGTEIWCRNMVPAYDL